MLASSLCGPRLGPSPAGPRVCPAPHLGQLRHCRPFHWGLLSRGHLAKVPEAGSVWRGRGACYGDKDECPFSGIGSGKQMGVLWPPGGREGTAGGAKRSTPPSFLPETSQTLTLRQLVIVQTLRPCIAPPVPLAGRMLGSPESLSLPCPLLCTSPVPLSGC